MKEKHNGKQTKQRLKPYLVLQYLLKNSDENHVVSATEIVGYLDSLEIYAERRSIYKDILEINQINWMLENDSDIIEAEQMIEEDINDYEKLIVYDKSKKGYYVRQRHFDMDDIRLLAECVYSAKFLSEKQTKNLVDVVCEFVSEHQANIIRTDAFLTDRRKIDNETLIFNISTINQAMAKKLDGAPHLPEKVSFKYMKYSISDMKQSVERRKGELYIVSPYKLLINDGYYYLLAFDDKKQDMVTYRVDRMKNVCLTGIPRAGEEIAKDFDINSFSQRTFSMFHGKKKRIRLQFRCQVLDSMIDRFGTHGVSYSKVDEEHYSLFTDIEISPQFFSWLSGFGRRIRLTAPQEVVNEYVKYLKHIQKMYES